MGLFDKFASEFGGDNEEAEVAEAPVVQEISDEDVDEELVEAEKRISKAAYYKVIVKNGLMEDNDTVEAQEINAEARLWARQQMAKLLGLREAQTETPAPVTPPQFNEKETYVLKKWVETVLKANGEAPEPTIKKVEAPPAPTIKKIVSSPAFKTEKPVKRPLPQKPEVVSKQEKEQGRAVKLPKDKDGNIDYDAIPTGKIFKDKDKNLYKFVPHPNEDNKRVKLKVTNQVRNEGMIPMPASRHAMEMAMQIQAEDSINTGASASATSPFEPDTNANINTFVKAAAGAMAKKGEQDNG